MTNQQAIDKALFMVGILSAGDSANATDSADMLDQLNQMMASWAVDDKDLQFPPQDTLSDTFPVPAWAEEGVISNLAIRAAALFEVAVPQQTAMIAMDGLKLIAKTIINANMKPLDMWHMPRGIRSRFDIITGFTR